VAEVTRLGFVGLGAMGEPMARRLVGAGHEVRAYDVRPERAEGLVAMGARAAGDVAEAAEGAEALVLMVVSGDQATGAVRDAGEALAAGSVVVLMSTVGPAAAEALADQLKARGVGFVDAPVSGGVRRAEAGDLLIMAGGDPQAFERVRPALEAMGSRVVHCGDGPGDGQKVKLVNQLLAGVHIAAAAEALAYAEGMGLDPRTVWEVVRHGAAGSFMLEDRGARMLDEAWTPPRSALDIFVKDMGLVVEAAGQHGLATPLSDVARGLYERGREEGLGAEDDSGVIRVIRAMRSNGPGAGPP
jgi:3-hydroxyisobutyrate dehydrogenase/putative dehydrogenase